MATVQRKTPGVYISEPNSFPPAIVGVETAVPAFIGYTETARYKGEDLNLRPTKISSMADYVSRFGRGYPEKYYLLESDGTVPGTDYVVVDKFTLFEGGKVYRLVESGTVNFLLYNSLRLFYENGGGDCWIVSCNRYDAAVKSADLQKGLDEIENVVGPTMLVSPDAVLLEKDDFNTIAQQMLRQCMEKQDRVAILDVLGAWDVPEKTGLDEAIQEFRDGLNGAPPESLRYGIAYFPNLKTSIVAADDLNITNFVGPAGIATLREALTEAVDRLYPVANPPASADEPDPARVRHDKVAEYVAKIGTTLEDDDEIRKTPPDKRTPPKALTHSELTAALLANIPGLRNMFHHAAASQNTLPPSAAMAGVFTTTDTTRGVWNAPANVGIAGLIEPTYEITDKQQEGLNVPPGGKAVNAIRTFPARGSLVWGARTLDSNSNDWRYIQVRRTMIYVEQSVKTALNAFVFAPNTASTWTTVTSMIESFLHGLWSSGGLMGASPAEAYGVRCGLGSTMTADDVLNGYMIVHIVLQMVHPAEFIELVFKQQMLGGGA
jgi:phage tail sheath protein FI